MHDDTRVPVLDNVFRPRAASDDRVPQRNVFGTPPEPDLAASFKSSSGPTGEHVGVSAVGIRGTTKIRSDSERLRQGIHTEVIRRFNLEIPHAERAPYDRETFDDFIDWIADANHDWTEKETRMTAVLDKLRLKS